MNAAEALLAAYNRRDAAAAAALYALDGEHREVAQGSTRSGREALEAGLARFFDAFPDARWDVRRRAREAPLYVALYRLTGTLSAQMGPFEPAGQRLELDGVLVIETDPRGSEVLRTTDFWDSGTFSRQMRGA